MPDISMCANEDCTLKENCYRFQAEASDYQTYSGFEQIDGECDYYWKIEEDEKL